MRGVVNGVNVGDYLLIHSGVQYAIPTAAGAYYWLEALGARATASSCNW